MALMLSELYYALLDGGTSEEKARKAAEAVASLDARLASMDARLQSMDARLQMLTWIAGIGFSALVAMSLVQANWMWQLLQHLPKL